MIQRVHFWAYTQKNWNQELEEISVHSCLWQHDSQLGFPGGSDSKESACNVGDLGSVPGLGRSPGEVNANPLQYFDLENSMERGYSPWGRKESDTTERLILTIHNCQKVEATHVPIDWWLDKQNVTHPCSGILFSFKSWAQVQLSHFLAGWPWASDTSVSSSVNEGNIRTVL